MKLCTFEIKTQLGKFFRLGAIIEQEIIDLNSAYRWHLFNEGESQPQQIADAILPTDMIQFLQGEKRSMNAAQNVIEEVTHALKSSEKIIGPNEETILFDFKNVKLKSPLMHPTSIRDFYAFEQHVKKGFEKRGEPMPQEWYEMPVYYKSGHWSIVGPNEDVSWPLFTEKFDYELELAIVIGQKGRDIKEENAREYIAGFTIMNDFSARDIQRKEMQVRLGPAKGKDFATGFGPVLVTSDEIGDPYNLKMTAKINGELWSEGNSGSIYHSFEKMIAFASMGETLYPGDIIGSGTVGTGCGLELDMWVQPGDVIELEIEKIGVLKNKVVKK